MKILLIIMSLFLFSCGSIKTTQNNEKKMKNYTFTYPAKTVYTSAKNYFNKKYKLLAYLGDKAEIVDGKKYQGEGTWLEKKSNLGGKDFLEKSRMLIRVKKLAKNKSTLMISEQRMTKASGKWTDSGTFRMPIHEYNVLKVVDPKLASAIEKEAAAAAK